jgi:putative two-component system response regulator
MEKMTALPRIMIVDDAEDNLMIMESILVKEYSLKLFSEAKVALDYANTNPPDLILLDIMMPGIDGFETCRMLKANSKLKDIPVIFITSKNEDEYEENGFSVGAADYIHKPINANILTARVRTHIKIKLAIEYLKNENAHLKLDNQQASSELAKVLNIICENPFNRV